MGNVRKIFLIILLFTNLLSAGQNKKVPLVVSAAIESNTFPFSKGKVFTSDGQTEEGQLQYNVMEEFLILQLGAESKTYYPKKTRGFSFWDEEAGQERVYVTLPWENPANNLIQSAFFEILREFKTFSLLSTRHLLDAVAVPIGLPPNSNTNVIPIGTRTKIKYQETICFIDEAGNLEPYVNIVNTEKDGIITDDFRSKRKNLNADLVEKYTGIYYEKLRKYSKENHLNFKSKQELLKILDYYGTLEVR